MAEQLAVKLEADADNVAALFGAEEVARAAEFEVAHGDAETRAELVVLAHRGEALAGDVEKLGVTMQQQVRVGLMFETSDAAAELVKL